MPDERHLLLVSDSSAATEIDRDLSQLLSIAPSPEFVPRVRKRIRDQAAARRSGAPWWIGVAAAAAVAMVVLFGSRGWRMEEAPHVVRATRDTVLPLVVTQPANQAGVRPVPPRVPSVAAGAADVGPAKPEVQPEVMVSRDQLRAIGRLQDLIRSGYLTEKNSPPVGSAPGAISEIEATPLTIAPLTVPAVEIVTGGDASRARSGR